MQLEIDMLLVGDTPPGTWVLTFNGTARRMLDDEEAMQTNAALDAVEAALGGVQDFDVFFGDLIERERLRAQAEGEKP
jgi:hydrogenase expression/formation protein HypC